MIHSSYEDRNQLKGPAKLKYCVQDKTRCVQGNAFSRPASTATGPAGEGVPRAPARYSNRNRSSIIYRTRP